jgi:hypothetical protein
MPQTASPIKNTINNNRMIKKPIEKKRTAKNNKCY